ncbi:MAG: tRNA (adenosine(37)-N6)-threonylcarbamoyltransferase complex ATPase subunit type 1 TsaE [Anaerotignum sp.]
MRKIWETFSAEETEAIGEKMGQEAMPGQVYSLEADLGCGKTVFAKGFARGLGITEHITSPTFTIINEYRGKIPLYHFDVYRISCEEEMDDTGYEDCFYGEGVSLVEWASLIPNLIPKSAIHIEIEKDFEKGDDYRRITVCKEGDI